MIKRRTFAPLKWITLRKEVKRVAGFLPKMDAFEVPSDMLLQVDVSDGSRGGFVVSCLSCFGGGVILTTALTHMLPEVNLFLQYNIQQGQLIDRVRIFKISRFSSRSVLHKLNFRVGLWLKSGCSVVSSWSTLWKRCHKPPSK